MPYVDDDDVSEYGTEVLGMICSYDGDGELEVSVVSVMMDCCGGVLFEVGWLEVLCTVFVSLQMKEIGDGRWNISLHGRRCLHAHQLKD